MDINMTDRPRTIRCSLLLIAALLWLVPMATFAAGGSLAGRVIDSTGAALPGVTVEATPAAGGKTLVITTDMSGHYALNGLDAGKWTLVFRLINFATTTHRDVGVRDSGTTSVDATVYLSSSADVVVTARRTFRNLNDLDEPVGNLQGIADSATVGVVTAKEIESRPVQRAGDIMETVPGVVVSQHSGEGKANQYYLRGFNLDHGTDIAITVAGAPVNMPTHAHGQGYADANFIIPELVSGVQYKKGPYFADEGDFASAGAVNVNYLTILEHPLAAVQVGQFGFERALYAASPRVGDGYLLYAVEAEHNDGPWRHPDDFRKVNGVARFTEGDQRGGLSITAMLYDARWSSTDQIPQRAIDDGSIGRFGEIDPTDGGSTHRYSLVADWQRNSANRLTQLTAYAIDYKLDLFSNFTYFLDDPIRGDQFEQHDDRIVTGFRGSQRWLANWGGRQVENVAGVELRHDDIRGVGLYHTEERVRLDTIRADAVQQTSGAIYGQSSIQWSDHLRTIAGLRADTYRFDVDAGDPRNGGRATASVVSPKLAIVFGPWRATELYLDAGSGFHSNDGRGSTITVDPSTGSPVSRVDPLLQTRGAEVGVRTSPAPDVQVTASLWGLDIDSELLFIGDAGSTEPSRPSHRTGLEVTGSWNLLRWLTLDSELAYSRARFRDVDPAGDRIPGAVEGVGSLGITMGELHGISASLRFRYFGPRPLIEDNSVRSSPSRLINGRISYRLTPRVRLDLDVFNLLNAEASDVDYFYASRLPGEPAGGVDDIHTHPVEPRSVRAGIVATF
jgi:hypothetical protein